jgi:plasmid stabilization system protein ParE
MISYELSLDAEEDLHEVIRYTLRRWGADQVRNYTQEVERGMDALANGYGHYETLEDIHPALRVKHCQHHYLFGLMREGLPILVIAIFHERMDLMAQLKGRLT